MDARSSAQEEVAVSDLPPRGLLQAVVEMSDDAIFTCDVAGRVTTWSATAERLFGSPARDVLGTSFSALFASHLRREVETAIDYRRRWRSHQAFRDRGGTARRDAYALVTVDVPPR